MKLLTALGLSAALLVANGWTLPSALAGEPAGSLPREQICSSPVTDQYGNTSQMCETVLGNPVNPLSPAFKVCMGFSTSPVRYLYCLNLLGSVTPPTTTSKPIATPTPTPEKSDCLVSLGDLRFGFTSSGRQVYELVMDSECAGNTVTWNVEYPNGRIRKQKTKVFLDGVAQLILEKGTKAHRIWVRSAGVESTGCYPQARWCD
jgi:hypothetical protein